MGDLDLDFVPIVSNQGHVEIVAGNLWLPSLELLHGFFTHEEGSSTCAESQDFELWLIALTS